MSARAFQAGERASLTRMISEGDIAGFAQLTGDTNPLHVDDAFARASRFGRRVAHGMLSAGLVSAVLGTRLPGPGAIYLKQSLHFLKPVYPGDTLTASVEVVAYRAEKGLLTLRTECRNQRGEQVLDGEALLLVR